MTRYITTNQVVGETWNSDDDDRGIEVGEVGEVKADGEEWNLSY